MVAHTIVRFFLHKTHLVFPVIFVRLLRFRANFSQIKKATYFVYGYRRVFLSAKFLIFIGACYFPAYLCGRFTLPPVCDRFFRAISVFGLWRPRRCLIIRRLFSCRSWARLFFVNSGNFCFHKNSGKYAA